MLISLEESQLQEHLVQIYCLIVLASFYFLPAEDEV